jgi:hypothetical protein
MIGHDHNYKIVASLQYGTAAAGYIIWSWLTMIGDDDNPIIRFYLLMYCELRCDSLSKSDIVVTLKTSVSGILAIGQSTMLMVITRQSLLYWISSESEFSLIGFQKSVVPDEWLGQYSDSEYLRHSWNWWTQRTQKNPYLVGEGAEWNRRIWAHNLWDPL